jgi:hypothetical protein
MGEFVELEVLAQQGLFQGTGRSRDGQGLGGGLQM